MKAMFLALAISAFRSYVGGGAYDRVVALVLEIASAELTGAEKMERVIAAAKREFRELSSTLIRAIVELTLIRRSA
jgi:hypothetical protein